MELTPREIEVLDELVEGYNNRAIGDHLGITLSTVTVHLVNIYRKLDIGRGGDIDPRTLTAVMWAQGEIDA